MLKAVSAPAIHTNAYPEPQGGFSNSAPIERATHDSSTTRALSMPRWIHYYSRVPPKK